VVSAGAAVWRAEGGSRWVLVCKDQHGSSRYNRGSSSYKCTKGIRSGSRIPCSGRRWPSLSTPWRYELAFSPLCPLHPWKTRNFR
jgi:hypothetical protein